MKHSIVAVVIASCFLVPHLHAQAPLILDKEEFVRAVVVEVATTTPLYVDAAVESEGSQLLKARVLRGDEAGKLFNANNDYQNLSVGQEFFARHISNSREGRDVWSVAEPYRLNVLMLCALLFVALVGVFGGLQGVRGLLSLLGSFVLIFYVLIPGIYAGYNPVLISVLVASLIVTVGSYITHGFNRTTSAAVIGMIITVVVTGLCAYYVVGASLLSGYTSEENVYLFHDTKGAIDMVGLLFGGIMIGLLGVLYDSAIGQAVAVEELYRAGAHLTRKEVYMRGIRIGREHIGALVNTLAIAYVGASLPLILLLQSSTAPLLYIINSEVFATEIIRILIGSAGLILAVPITTLIASHMLHNRAEARTGSHSHHGH